MHPTSNQRSGAGAGAGAAGPAAERIPGGAHCRNVNSSVAIRVTCRVTALAAPAAGESVGRRPQCQGKWRWRRCRTAAALVCGMQGRAEPAAAVADAGYHGHAQGRGRKQRLLGALPPCLLLPAARGRRRRAAARAGADDVGGGASVGSDGDWVGAEQSLGEDWLRDQAPSAALASRKASLLRI